MTATLHNSEPTDIVVGPRPRNRWALWGVAAGLLGFVATMGTDGHTGDITDAADRLGAREIELLDRGIFHVGVVAGFLAVGAMLVTAAAWRRWAERKAPDSLAARTFGMALLATAASMMLGYGFKGSLAVYLPGGIDENTYPKEGLYAVWMFLDFAPYICWWGATVAAAASVWLAFRERLLPRWIGVAGIVFVLAPVAFMVGTGLPGFPGVVSPAWLVLFSIGAALRRD
jgi:hypothetical protein